jgi:acyl-CoA reductase-like NAD-dependent aldehyde dehydrogenase
MGDAKNMYIDGQWAEAKSGKTFTTVNPATEEVIAEVPEAGAEDVDKAVQAARRAFDERVWTGIDVVERERILRKVADLIRRDAEEIARTECLDVGKPIDECRGDVEFGLSLFEFWSGVPTKLNGTVNPVSGDYFAYVLRDPVGVVGQIMPWNFPFVLCCMKIPLALATGNTCVVKPAEETPLTALMLADLLEEAGVPAGVVNILTGGPDTGAAIVEHRGVNKISFTGSTEVGKLIMNVASRDLKRLSLELGGKTPSMVFADADLDQAVKGTLFGIYFNSGQVCCAGSRVFVQQDIHDEFLDKFAEQADTIRLGNPMEPETQLGPLVSQRQLERVCGYVEAGKEEGAELVLGGDRPDEGDLGKGYFLKPTVFDHVDNQMKIAREEIFGPVVAVIPFKDMEDGLRLANETAYGLASAIWTQDVKKAFRFIRDIRAGTVWVNAHHLFGPTTPWGGYKESGIGRENGLDAIEAYTERKTVWIHTGEQGIDHYGS